MEKEVVPTVDYTRDYRRFSYADFKIPETGEGKSTVDPELVADWLDRAVPRNQDDAYPLFILCKDLLRKFHQKEVRYAVQKEQDMMDEIQMMKDALQGNQEILLSQKRLQEEENARLKTQLAVAEQKRLSTQEDLDILRAEHEKYKKHHKKKIILPLLVLGFVKGNAIVLSLFWNPTEHRGPSAAPAGPVAAYSVNASSICHRCKLAQPFTLPTLPLQMLGLVLGMVFM